MSNSVDDLKHASIDICSNIISSNTNNNQIFPTVLKLIDFLILFALLHLSKSIWTIE